ncbi:MAG TPA: DUF4402 domain-containing protein [Sphingomicrobium sp.]|jgi:hypothetical protein|nr:DUF4402 domain-containing protein [Sphingomicrobium sp.]
MAFRYALASSFVAATLLAGASAPAPAQCRLCERPTTDLQETEGGGPISLEMDTVLDFDRLVLLGGGGDGTATLLPSGERNAAGSVATVSAKAMVGSISVHGDPGRMLRVELPRQITLYSINGGRVAISDIETDLPGLPKLDSAGNLDFRFGGRLTITGDSEGEYRGDIPITVEYL